MYKKQSCNIRKNDENEKKKMYNTNLNKFTTCNQVKKEKETKYNEKYDG